jgi:DNA-binding protein H-NS
LVALLGRCSRFGAKNDNSRPARKFRSLPGGLGFINWLTPFSEKYTLVPSHVPVFGSRRAYRSFGAAVAIQIIAVVAATVVAAALQTVGSMKNSALKSMAIDELWELHEEITAKLARELTIKKTRLEKWLHKIGLAKRPYPKVHPKYRNPKDPAETWSGRGKQPRWLRAQLRSGKTVNDFLIR